MAPQPDIRAFFDAATQTISYLVRAGRLPEAESNGMRYLKIPLRMAQPVAGR